MKSALALLLLAAAPASAETFEVRMLNRGAAGPMVYEPDFLRVAPGDTVKFIATTNGHNAASIEGMLPAGMAPFKGRINEEITLTPTAEGMIGVRCSPHFAMGMVMLIAVGAADVATAPLPADLPARARQRFEEILARAAD